MAKQGELPQLQRREKIDGTVSVGNFQDVMTNLAVNTNGLGEFGAFVSQKASNRLAEINGYERGQNPEGDILPAFSESDEHYIRAYNNGAMTNLSLQGQAASAKAQLELSKQPSISQENISTYTENMQKIHENLLELAPTDVKQKLSGQFSSSLLSSTTSLQEKLVIQNKKESLDKANASNNVASAEIYNFGVKGQFELAEQQQKDLVELNRSRLQTKEITQTQFDAIETQSKITLQSGIIGFSAAAALNDNNAGNFLKELDNFKVPNVNELEAQAVKKNVLAYVKSRQALKVQSQQEIMGSLTTKSIAGTLTQNDIEEAKASLTHNQFYQATYKIQRSGSKALRTQQETAFAIKNFNTQNFAFLTQTQKNNAYNSKVISEMANPKYKGKLSFDAATAIVMSDANGKVNAFSEHVSERIRNAGAGQMNDIVQAIRYVQKHKGANISLTAQEEAIVSSYEASKASKNPLHSDQDVLDKVKDNLVNRSDTELAASKVATNTYLSAHFPSPQSRENFFLGMFDAPRGDFRNFANATMNAEKLWRINAQANRNDYQQASKTTRRMMANSFGYSTVNGKSQFVYMPIAKILGASRETEPLIQAQIAESLKQQLEETNLAFKNGTNDFRLEVSNVNNVQIGLDAKIELTRMQEVGREKGQSTKDFLDKAEQLQLKTRRTVTNNPAKLTKIFRDPRIPRQTYTIGVEAISSIGLSPDHKVAGSWNITARDERGALVPIHGVGHLSQGTPAFKADVEKLQAQSAIMLGINPKANQTYAEAYLEWAKEHEHDGEFNVPDERMREAILNVSLFGGNR
jgi:hypothetical protein